MAIVVDGAKCFPHTTHQRIIMGGGDKPKEPKEPKKPKKPKKPKGTQETQGTQPTQPNLDLQISRVQRALES